MRAWLSSLGAVAVMASQPLVAAAGASGQEVGYRGSFQVSTGDYVFDERTTSLYLFSGLDLRFERFTLATSLPLILQNSGVVSLVGGVPVPTGGERHGQLRGLSGDGSSGRVDGVRVGPEGSFDELPGGSAVEQEVDIPAGESYELSIGDPLISASWDAVTGSGPLRTIHVEGLVKVPVSDLESGVGTGEWDVGAGLGFGVSAGRALILGSATYWWLGDLPDLELEDGVSYALSVGTPVGGSDLVVLVSLLGSTEVIEGIAPPVSVGAGLGFGLGERLRLNVSASLGLTESAADVSTAVGWDARLARTR